MKQRRTTKARNADPAEPAAVNAREGVALKEHLKKPFLAAFEKAQGITYKAAEAVGINHHTVAVWKKEDPAFAEEFTRVEINTKGKENELLVRSCMISAIEGDPEYLIKDGQNVLQLDGKGEPLTDAQGRPIPVILRRRFDGHLRTFLMERRMPNEYSAKIETRVPASFIAQISSSFMSILRRLVPEVCPHCKSHLGLHPEIVKELETISAKMPVS